MYFIYCSQFKSVLSTTGWVFLPMLRQKSADLISLININNAEYIAQKVRERNKAAGYVGNVTFIRRNTLKNAVLENHKQTKLIREGFTDQPQLALEMEAHRFRVIKSTNFLQLGTVTQQSQVNKKLQLEKLVNDPEPIIKVEKPTTEEQPMKKTSKKNNSFFRKLFRKEKKQTLTTQKEIPIQKETVNVPIEPIPEPVKIKKLTIDTSLIESYVLVDLINTMADTFNKLDELVSEGTIKMYGDALSEVDKQIGDELHFIEIVDLEDDSFYATQICARLKELRLKRRKIKDNMELAGLLRSYVQNEKAGEIKSIAKKVEAMKKRKYAVRDPENFQH